jgi:hypothetical protein
MNGTPTSSGGPGELVIPLSHPDHLFNPPRIDPMSRCPAEVLGVSGVEHLLGQLHLNRQRQAVPTLVLLLPPDKASPALAEPTTLALHRYAAARIEENRRTLSKTYRYGWRATGVAVVVLAICLALSHLFASEWTNWMGPLLRKTFEYGFEIVGWVMLWHPIDVLGFTPLGIRAQMRALQALQRMSVIIRADQGLADGAPRA